MIRFQGEGAGAVGQRRRQITQITLDVVAIQVRRVTGWLVVVVDVDYVVDVARGEQFANRCSITYVLYMFIDIYIMHSVLDY